MTPLQALEAIKSEAEVCLCAYLGQKEETAESPDYVKPHVFICQLPHKNKNKDNFEIPHVLVTFDTITDSGSECTMILRLNVGVYGGGNYEGDSIPDEKQYIDLLTVLQKLKQHLLSKAVINGLVSVRYPCTMGFYNEEETWPFLYGYLTFECDILSDSYVFKNEF